MNFIFKNSAAAGEIYLEVFKVCQGEVVDLVVSKHGTNVAHSRLHLPLLPSAIHHTSTYAHTHPFNGPLSGTTRVSRYQKGKTNLDFTEAREQ